MSLSYPVHLTWPGGRRVEAVVEGKPPVEIATPPEFKGTFPDRWSPEDFLVAAAGSCFSVTLIGMAERKGVPLLDLDVRATGTLDRADRGPLLFTRIRLEVDAATEAGHEDELRALAETAEQACLVSQALTIPVDAEVRIAVPAA